MLALGSLAFASPWLLAALAALPVMWWLLRVTPPAPRRVAFPAIRLLLGLTAARGDAGAHAVVAHSAAHDRRRRWSSSRSPIRCSTRTRQLAGSRHAGRSSSTTAGPRRATGPRARTRRSTILAEAGREGRAGRTADHRAARLGPAAAAARTDPRPPMRAPRSRRCSPSRGPTTARRRWPGCQGDAACPARTTAVWLSDGIDDAGADNAAGGAAARQIAGAALPHRRGPAMRRACARRRTPRRPSWRRQEIGVAVRSLPARAAAPDRRCAPAREDGPLLAREPATIAAGARQRRWSACRCRANCATGSRGSRSKASNRAGGVLLVDERWRRRPVGIVAAAAAPAAQPLLSEIYYLERALGAVHRGAPRARRRSVEAPDLAVLIYADGGPDSPAEEAAVRQMGRGRRRCCCALPDRGSPNSATICCRCGCARGGRTIGGALSWEKPAKLAPVRRQQPVRRAGDPRRCHRVAPGSGRARSRSRRQDLGAARRRHPAGHRRKARPAAGSCWSTPPPMPNGRIWRSPASSSRCCGASWR